jgi:hypothetical protein
MVRRRGSKEEEGEERRKGGKGALSVGRSGTKKKKRKAQRGSPSGESSSRTKAMTMW